MRAVYLRLKNEYKKLGLFEYLYFIIRWRLAAFDKIEPLIPEGGRILDFGCGSGILVNALASGSSRREVIGFDISWEKIKQARAAGANISNVNFTSEEAGGSFDAIIMMDVLHHLRKDEQRQTLLKLKNKLKAGGVFIIQDINKRSFPRYLIGWCIDALFCGYKNVAYRTKDEIVEMLQELGFRVEISGEDGIAHVIFTAALLKINMDDKYKIIFISPPLSPEKQAGGLADIANIQPTLGIGYIAALLLKNDFAAEIIDCYLRNYSFKEVEAMIKEKKPQAIGMTATIMNVSDAKAIAKYLKEKFPEIVFFIGGPQLTSDIGTVFEESDFDFAIYGEGEYTTLELGETLRQSSNDFEKILGLVWRGKDGVVVNPPRPCITDLDELPMPARQLYPHIKEYRPVPASYKRLPVGQMITSRGCPYQCIFCDRSVFGNRYRAHSAKYVLAEIESLTKDYGAREIRFMDDTFSLIPERVEEICRGIIERGFDITWSCLTRVDRVSPELLKMMKKAGCWQVIYGLESGDPEILKTVKKGTTIEQAEKAVKWSKDAGLNVRATFILGLPGENAQTIRRTVDFAKRLNLDVVNFFTVVLYPGNELYQIAFREGKVLHKNYDEYTSLIDTKDAHLHYVPDGMTEAELKRAISWAYHSYYLRPGFLVKQVLGIRSLVDIGRYWQAFKAVVKI